MKKKSTYKIRRINAWEWEGKEDKKMNANGKKTHKKNEGKKEKNQLTGDEKKQWISEEEEKEEEEEENTPVQLRNNA